MLKSLQASKDETEAGFGPIEDKYVSLAKFDVTPTEEESAWLAGLHIQWEEFQGTLRRAENMLQSSICFTK